MKTKKTSIIVIMILTGIFSMVLLGCNYNGNKVDDRYPSSSEIYSLNGSHWTSFAKLRFSKVYDNIYFDEFADRSYLRKYAVVEFEIIEDYYNKRAAGTLITMPIELDISYYKGVYLTKDDVESIFIKSDFVYAYTVGAGSNRADNGGYLNNLERANDPEYTDVKDWFNNLVYNISLMSAQIIPVVDRKVDFSPIINAFNTIDLTYDETWVGGTIYKIDPRSYAVDAAGSLKDSTLGCKFWYYIEELGEYKAFYEEGTPYETLESNIKELYQRQLNGVVDNHPPRDKNVDY